MFALLVKCAFVVNILSQIRRLGCFSQMVQVFISAEMSFVCFSHFDVCSVNFVKLFLRDTNVR